MKKVHQILKPFISIIFGAVLLLYYLNGLGSNTTIGITLGIIAIVLAVYYLTLGILSLIIGDKFTAKLRMIFDIVTIVLFPLFMFVEYLLMTINIAQQMGPTGWIIVITSMIGSIALAVFYPISKFVKNDIVKRFNFVFSAVFVLVLLLNIVFTSVGDAITLGNVDLIMLVIDVLFVTILADSLNKPMELAHQSGENSKDEEKHEENREETIEE